jgi:hypothetical protein
MEKIGIQARDKALQVLTEKKKGMLKEGITWGDRAVLKEMITTETGASAFIEKITYELYSAREVTPLLYNDIYTVISDRTLPELLTVKLVGPGQVVFLEHLEGEEVKFGTLQANNDLVVRIKTYAAGMQITEDMIEYNQLYTIAEISQDLGIAYNKLLNHIHLAPILLGTYTTATGGAKGQMNAQIQGQPQLVDWNTDLKKTLATALAVAPFIDFKVLISSADYFSVLDAVNAMVNQDGTASIIKKKFTEDRFMVYDGEVIPVGAKTVEYPGVQPGYIYMVSTAKRNFRNYTKHDLIIDADNADLSRLLEEQIVARARLGVAAQLGGRYGAIKVKITSA